MAGDWLTKELGWMIVFVGMLALSGGVGCAAPPAPNDSTRPDSLQPPHLRNREGSQDQTGFSGLPVVRLSFVCGASSKICVFRDKDFRNHLSSDRREQSEIAFNPEVPLVPQAEYTIECNLRDSDDDWERSMLGAVVEECSFELTLAAYPEDSEEVRSAGRQTEPVSPPSGVVPDGAILPPSAFPPGPARTHAVQTIEAMPPRTDYRAECTVRPPISSESEAYLVPAVWNCGIVSHRSDMKFPDRP